MVKLHVLYELLLRPHLTLAAQQMIDLFGRENLQGCNREHFIECIGEGIHLRHDAFRHRGLDHCFHVLAKVVNGYFLYDTSIQEDQTHTSFRLSKAIGLRN